METWATFSIIDHRRPIYRQALALFDRIVVPLPSKPIGDQTQEELDQLEAEVEYLKWAEAAELYEWKSAEFEEWRQPFLAEAPSGMEARQSPRYCAGRRSKGNNSSGHARFRQTHESLRRGYGV
jgi:hypothetical protein